MGVLGESNRLTDNERADLIEAAVGVSNDVDGDFPIVVGTRRDPFNSSPNGGQISISSARLHVRSTPAGRTCR